MKPPTKKAKIQSNSTNSVLSCYWISFSMIETPREQWTFRNISVNWSMNLQTLNQSRIGTFTITNKEEFSFEIFSHTYTCYEWTYDTCLSKTTINLYMYMAIMKVLATFPIVRLIVQSWLMNIQLQCTYICWYSTNSFLYWTWKCTWSTLTL